MEKVMSMESIRKAMDDQEFLDKINNQIFAKYRDSLLILESEEGVTYSHSGRNPVDLIAKFIKAKADSGVTTTDDFLANLTVVLKSNKEVS